MQIQESAECNGHKMLKIFTSLLKAKSILFSIAFVNCINSIPPNYFLTDKSDTSQHENSQVNEPCRQ